MDDRALHAHLLNQQGSRAALNTPALVIDADALGRNIAAMAGFAAEAGLALRPHAKTHKSADIARLQIEAGAVGVCCAKLGEAEALAQSGAVRSILITSPVVPAPAIARLVALHRTLPDLALVADNPSNVAALEHALSHADAQLKVFVDFDPGLHRTGAASAEAVLALAAQIAASPRLRFGGVQFYCGREQHIENYGERRVAIEKRTAMLAALVAQLRAAGLPPPVITGGGTGTHRIDAALGVFTELQAGSYVFMDRQYHACALDESGSALFETALVIDARIVSANTPGMATLDAGFKAMATDGGPPAILDGAPDGAVYHFMGDEHGAIIAKEHLFALGDRVIFGAPHCDPTVNLYDFYHVVRGDTLTDIWPVTARGRSR